MAMIFQDAMTALNPVFTVGDQIIEALSCTTRRMKDERFAGARDPAPPRSFGMPVPERRADQYPTSSRAGSPAGMIAMAIADDPRAHRRRADDRSRRDDSGAGARGAVAAQKEPHSAIILITHDLGWWPSWPDRVIVMYAGREVDNGDVFRDLRLASHPYTIGLMDSAEVRRRAGTTRSNRGPTTGSSPRPRCAFHPRSGVASPIVCRTDVPALRAPLGGKNPSLGLSLRRRIARNAPRRIWLAKDNEQKHRPRRRRQRDRWRATRIEGLVKQFPVKGGVLKRTSLKCRPWTASLDGNPGETLASSGSRAAARPRWRKLMKLIEPTAGDRASTAEIPALKRRDAAPPARLQIVFQDPYASLNPRMTVARIVAEPLRVHGSTAAKSVSDRVGELLARWG